MPERLPVDDIAKEASSLAKTLEEGSQEAKTLALEQLLRRIDRLEKTTRRLENTTRYITPLR
ncbi:hypothetical protein HYW46_02845 [Candidatus Daviesbacteria bacterium]|nr:hypothetical protein [Candidatus Daviesbacteria bacterium]